MQATLAASTAEEQLSFTDQVTRYGPPVMSGSGGAGGDFVQAGPVTIPLLLRAGWNPASIPPRSVGLAEAQWNLESYVSEVIVPVGANRG